MHSLVTPLNGLNPKDEQATAAPLDALNRRQRRFRFIYTADGAALMPLPR